MTIYRALTLVWILLAPIIDLDEHRSPGETDRSPDQVIHGYEVLLKLWWPVAELSPPQRMLKRSGGSISRQLPSSLGSRPAGDGTGIGGPLFPVSILPMIHLLPYTIVRVPISLCKTQCGRCGRVRAICPHFPSDLARFPDIPIDIVGPSSTGQPTLSRFEHHLPQI